MSYSRTTWVSGETPLSADNMNNIEDGIEENASDIADLNSNLNQAIKLISFSKSYTASYQANLNDLVTVPSGYTAVSPVNVDTGNSNIALIALKKNGVVLNKFYQGGTSTTQTCSGYVMCVKNEFL